MARSLARELESRGVTANVVAPGFIETDMTAALGEDLTKSYAAQIPLGRMGTVDDVAAVIEFLAGDGAGYITGAWSRSTAAWEWVTDGHPGGQEHPGRRGHPGHLDRVPRGPGRAGRGRHGGGLQLRPGDEPDRAG